jgi:WD40 repeat protein
VNSAAFSPDGLRIVTASADKTARVWDSETGKAIGAPLEGHDSPVYDAAFSPDGRRIITASADKTARIWDAATGQPIGEPLKGHEGAVYSAGFSPDNRICRQNGADLGRRDRPADRRAAERT